MMMMLDVSHDNNGNNSSSCSTVREPSLSEHTFADYSHCEYLVVDNNSHENDAESKSSTFSAIRTRTPLDRSGSLLSITSSSGTFSTNGSDFSDSLSSFSCDSLEELTTHAADNAEDFTETTIHGFDDYIVPRKAVRFGSITVREYAVTVGSHHDLKCPIALSWEYRQYFWFNHASYSASSAAQHHHACSERQQRRRNKCPGVVHHLGLSERRKWIARVQGITKAQVKLMEQEMLQLQEEEQEISLGATTSTTTRVRRQRSSSITKDDYMVDAGFKYHHHHVNHASLCIGGGTDAPPRKPHKRK